MGKGIVADALETEVQRDVSPEKTVEETVQELLDSSEDRALRPRTLKDYIGQEDAKQQLEIYLQAAKKRGEALDHQV